MYFDMRGSVEFAEGEGELYLFSQHFKGIKVLRALARYAQLSTTRATRVDTNFGDSSVIDVEQKSRIEDPSN